MGIAGQDLNEGNTTLTLALVWQLMRSYTLSVLSSLNQSTSNAKVEQEIIKWVNEKLESCGKAESKINSFQDSKISTAKPIIDLIDAIKPGVINYELLQENGGTYEVMVVAYSLIVLVYGSRSSTSFVMFSNQLRSFHLYFSP